MIPLRDMIASGFESSINTHHKTLGNLGNAIGDLYSVLRIQTLIGSWLCYGGDFSESR
jgi:hypothetical protein